MDAGIAARSAERRVMRRMASRAEKRRNVRRMTRRGAVAYALFGAALAAYIAGETTRALPLGTSGVAAMGTAIGGLIGWRLLRRMPTNEASEAIDPRIEQARTSAWFMLAVDASCPALLVRFHQVFVGAAADGAGAPQAEAFVTVLIATLGCVSGAFGLLAILATEPKAPKKERRAPAFRMAMRRAP